MKRRPPTREIKPRILIVTEGESEEQYFKTLKSKLFKRMSVEIIKGKHSDALSVLKTAKNEIKNARDNQYTFAYAVIDRESPNSNTKNIQDAIDESKTKTKVRGGIFCDLNISNPSFEFWLLLHFKCTTKSFLNSKQLETELKNFILDYKKPYEFSKIIGNGNSDDLDKKLETAIGNSKKVNNYHIEKK